MGSAQSLFTSQNLLAAAVLVAIVASVWYKNADTIASATVATGKSPSTGKKGKKKRPAGGVPDTSSANSDREKGGGATIPPQSGLVERTVPGGIPEPAVEALQPNATKGLKDKKRKSRKSATPTPSSKNPESSSVAGPSAPSSQSASTSTAQPQVQTRVPTSSDESWTRVESRRRTSGQNAATSDAGVTTASVTEEDGSSSGVLEKSAEGGATRPQKTLAEKMLPKGRKTAVDDMLESSHYPELSRVMQIVPDEAQKPASGFSWGDYEDVEDTRGADADGEDDGGWGVVKSRGKAKRGQSFTNAAVTPQPKAPETLTKKQRQNAAKREAAKIAKADAEAERQAQLAKHKREIESARIAEQYSRKGSGSARGNLSGGMSAKVSEQGNLVWD